MATLIFSADPAQPTRDGWYQVAFHLDGREPPFPKRTVDVKTTAEALAAFDAYKAEATATGLPMAAAMRLAKGSRAPNGFKAATAKQFYHRINV